LPANQIVTKGKILSKSKPLHFLRLFLSVPLLVTLSSLANGSDKPIGFEADNVVVKQHDGSLFATGNVELKQGKNTLRADEVTYSREQNKAIARGSVIHNDAAGTVTRANVMELDTEFSHILAETIISKFASGDWISADSADRIVGDKSVFENSRFTPCNCNFVNGEQPLWDIKASQTVRNEKTKTITHYNMRMSVMNVPVGYLPFLSHPDWTVRRRSGFLTPSFKISSDLDFHQPSHTITSSTKRVI
jgi:LPS-assembly protein